MPRPTPRASSGRRLAPKISTRIVTMITTSGIPSPIVRLLSRPSHARCDRANRPRHSTTGSAAGPSMLACVAFPALTLGAAISAMQLPQFATTVQVVEVYASVTDARGEPLRGLSQDQFTVREDGELQTISTFAEGEFPLSVAVGVDRSWSMAGDRLAVAKVGARTLLAELRPDDQAMVVAI